MSTNILKQYLALFTSGIAFGACLSLPVTADDGAKLDEIIVTARKREESLTDVPESVAAISSDTITRHNVKTLDKVGLQIPNFNLNTRADLMPNVSMRGMGAFSLTQGVGFFLDDVQLFSDASSRFGDLERIEVLKGPQGVLYGGSSIGGAVKFIAKRPSADELSGSVKLMAGQQNSTDVEASINVPMSDSWAMRAFAFRAEDDGFLYNPLYDDDSIAGWEKIGGRLSIAGPLSDNLSLYASARYNEYDGPNNTWVYQPYTPPNTRPNFSYTREVDIDTINNADQENNGLHLELVWELGGFDVTSITGYTKTEQVRTTDVDLTRDAVYDVVQTEEMETITQEIRLTSTTESNLQWQAGLYTSTYERDEQTTAIIFGGAVVDPGSRVDSQERTHLAAFGNLTYTAGPWEMAFGLRVDSWEHKNQLDPTTSYLPPQSYELGLVHKGKTDGTEVLPRLSIARDLSDNTMAYLTVSQGYEPGQAKHDGPYIDEQGNPQLTILGKEEATQIELGLKGSFSDGSGTFAIAAFMIDSKDRVFTKVLSRASDGLYESMENVGDAENSGIEIEITKQVTENLTIALAAGVLDAEFKNGAEAAGVDVSGLTPTSTIDNGIMLNATYNKPLSGDMELIGDLMYTRRGEGVGYPAHDAPINPSYATVNLSAGVRGENWQLMVHGENIFDEEYYTDADNFANLWAYPGNLFTDGTYPTLTMGTWGQPRMVSVSLTYDF